MELECRGNKLHGATYSDHGFVIIGMLFPLEKSLPHYWKEGNGGYGIHCKVRGCVCVRE